MLIKIQVNYLSRHLSDDSLSHIGVALNISYQILLLLVINLHSFLFRQLKKYRKTQLTRVRETVDNLPKAPEVPTAKSTATVVKNKHTNTMLETNINSTSSDQEKTDFSFN